MSAVSQQIPNLMGGVSQQPDPLKLPGQVREAVNVLLDPTFGCKKRPPTRFLNELATNIPENASWFPIFRDDKERYLAAVYQGTNSSTTYVVTVAANKLILDGGSANATLTLNEGSTYIFDLGDSTCANKTLKFSTTADGSHGSGSEYTTGVVSYGTPGTTGAFIKITIASSAPTLYYYDSTTASAGGQINTNTNSTSSTHIRIWDALNGHEKKVTSIGNAADYIKVASAQNLRPLTINDYTLLCNQEKTISMSENTIDPAVQEAIVVVNQVAYNTTYAIDFLRDGTVSAQEKIYRAKVLTASQVEEDTSTGSCPKAGSQSFTKASGSKTGLGFTITTTCNPTQVQTEIEQPPYPTHVSRVADFSRSFPFKYHMQAWATKYHGTATSQPQNQIRSRTETINTSAGNIQLRIDVRAVKHPNATSDETYPEDYSDTNKAGKKLSEFWGDTQKWEFDAVYVVGTPTTTSTEWQTGTEIAAQTTFSSDINLNYPEGGIIPYVSGENTAGMLFKIETIQRPEPTIEYSYKSVYNTRVRLNNGGQNWRQGDTVTATMNGHDYTITVEEETFSFNYASENQVTHTTPLDTSQGQLNVGSIVSALQAGVDGLTPYSATAVGNVVYIKRTDGREFNIQARGGTVNNALYAIKNSVNDVSLLPNQCEPDVVLLVRNSADSESDDYYVKFVPASGEIRGMGSWEETVKPGIVTDLNTDTMPHALIRGADGNFTLRSLARIHDDTLFWAGREVGDTKTNPAPSFVDQKVQDMFFFMNRLGFLTEDSVVLSQPGDYFNFFVGSSIAVSDADPIDMTASATKPAKLKAALGTPKGLLLFAENSQFLLATSEAAFGPATVKMTELTNYAYSSKIKPLETGVSILFSTEADTYSKVFEMSVDSIDNRPLVAENTRIIPEYIPPDLKTSTASANNSFCAFGNDTNTLYTFKFFNTGNERSLAGWSKWQLPAKVKLFEFAHDTGYFVLYNNGSYILSKLEFLDDPETSPISFEGTKFVPRLDNYLIKSQVTTEAGASTTKLRFPAGSFVVDATPNVIFTTGGTATLFQRPAIQSDATGYYVEVDNDIASEDFILGLEYDMSVSLPSFYLTQEKRADRNNIPVVENVYLDLYLSGRYSVSIEKTGYTTTSIDLDVTPADIYTANQPAIQDVTTKPVPIFSRGDFVKMTVKAQDPLPAAITSYSWEGHYSNRGINILR
tara:strand:- start:636 stop:4229 length:3594 start_codon:yes stop_codon:yes gene_type:complete